MGTLLAQVVPLAAGAAVSPGLLALQMLNLSRPSGGLARAWSVLAGAAAVVAAVSVAALFVTVSLGDLGRDQTLRAVIRLVAAMVLVGIAVFELVHPARPPRHDQARGPDEPRRGPLYLTSAGLGAALAAPNMALYLPAAHEIARSTVSAPEKLVAFVVAAAVALTPVAGPPVAVTVLGDRARPTLEALNGFVTRNSRAVTIVACLGFAAYLAVTGLHALTGELGAMWDDRGVDDVVARYRIASEANDIDAVMATLAPDAELVSPLSGRMVFRGHDDLRVLLTAVYSGMRGLRWRDEVGDGRLRVLTGDASVGPVKLGDAMVFELAADGQIQRIRPHLRPWLALTLLALRLGPALARHPGVIRRALTPA